MIQLPPVAISKIKNSVQALCTADTTRTSSWGDITGCSLPLGIGTWFIIGQVTTVTPGGVPRTCSTKIYYGSTDLAIAETSAGVDFGITISIQSIVTLTSPQTVKLAAKQLDGANGTTFRYVEAAIPGTLLIALQLS